MTVGSEEQVSIEWFSEAGCKLKLAKEEKEQGVLCECLAIAEQITGKKKLVRTEEVVPM